jgi:hypothetical protein
MINITYTINGKTINPQDSSAVERAIFEGVVEKAITVVKSKLLPDEVSKLTINVVGDSLEKLSLNIKGPDDILAKLRGKL